MTCLNCSRIAPERHGFCPYCGAILGSPPAESEYQEVPPGMAQKQIAAPDNAPRSPGPLLTGGIALDAALGFLGEIVAFALLVYSMWQFFRLLGEIPESAERFYFLLGMFLTSVFLFWYTKEMRVRYPTFAKGWQTGRDTWGKGVDHLLTLIFGILMLCVLFPLGGLLMCLGVSYGPIAWIGALCVAYILGMLARRMSGGGNKKPGEKTP
ncbi:MAG: hypothetical protein H8F28_26765 [Fibrella sp.]|nr:hypothetical protein [Armatimonadota bacterium]